MVDTYVVMNVVLLILSYTKEKDAIIFTHPPAVSFIFI
jgi:signal peptidase complex subunit 2